MKIEDLIPNRSLAGNPIIILSECGEGELLIEILRERLIKVRQQGRANRYEYEINVLKEVTQLYGIEIDYNKVVKCINSLLMIVEAEYVEIFGDNIDKKFIRLVKQVFNRNIMDGDSLTLCTPNDTTNLRFPVWKIINDNRLIFRYFMFYDLYIPSLENGKIVYNELILEMNNNIPLMIDGSWNRVDGQWCSPF